MTTPARRLDILRQLDKAPDGLRIKQVTGLTEAAAGVYLNAIADAGWADRVPMRKPNGSHKPQCRFVINAVGRSVLAGAEAGETFA